MHREFCTLFDTNYLIKAVAMYRSLARHAPSFRLTAFCFDDRAKELLDRLGLPGLVAVPLAELEGFDPELASVKGDRSPIEYCWTATPALPLFVFGTSEEVDEVTYVDADLMFFSDPEPLFEEMGDASVLITPHRYSPQFRYQEASGIYNVQFLTFRRDDHGLEALRWWHDRCIEWCYFRYEDGKLGDQKYLDDWPERFDGIHVLEHKGGGLAPWNVNRYRIHDEGGSVLVDQDPLVFFHYHRLSLRREARSQLYPAEYHLSRRERRLIYRPYLAELDAALEQIRSVEPGFSSGFAPPAGFGRRLVDTGVSARALAGSKRVALSRLLQART